MSVARGKYITENERDTMRVGVKHGLTIAEIAKGMGRTRMGVNTHVKAMRDAGTLSDRPLLPHVEAAILEGLKNA
jgi:IS30 family transposase